jgi:hypothetical protein
MDEKEKAVLTNVLVIGGSGTGKTVKYIKPNILRESCGMICEPPSKKVLKDFIEDNQIKGINADNMEDNGVAGNISLDYTNHLVYVTGTDLVYGREGLVKHD